MELIPIAVSEYADPAGKGKDLTDPGDSVLKPFFEERCYTYIRDDLPDIGFREPQRIAIEYLEADFAEVVTKAQVSDSEILDFYNKYKKQLFRRPEADARTCV